MIKSGDFLLLSWTAKILKVLFLEHRRLCPAHNCYIKRKRALFYTLERQSNRRRNSLLRERADTARFDNHEFGSARVRIQNKILQGAQLLAVVILDGHAAQHLELRIMQRFIWRCVLRAGGHTSNQKEKPRNDPKSH